MMKFVKSDVWCTLFNAESEESALRLFNNIFQRPLTVGQFIDSTEEQFRRMIYRSYVLHDLLKPYIHRKNGLNLDGMPEKNECVLYVCLTDVQRRLYSVIYLFFILFLKTLRYVLHLFNRNSSSWLKTKEIDEITDRNRRCYVIKTYLH